MGGQLLQRPHGFEESSNFDRETWELGGRKDRKVMVNVKALDVCQEWIVPNSPGSLVEDFVMQLFERDLGLVLVIVITGDKLETQVKDGRAGGPESEGTLGDGAAGERYLEFDFLDRVFRILVNDCVPQDRRGEHFLRGRAVGVTLVHECCVHRGRTRYTSRDFITGSPSSTIRVKATTFGRTTARSRGMPSSSISPMKSM